MSRHDGNPPPLTRPEFPTLALRLDPPRILMLYGSLRERSYSRLLAEEAGRILEGLGCDVRFFNPDGLPVKGPDLDEHPKVQELRALTHWSEGHVWSSPEMHGAITGVFKNLPARLRPSAAPGTATKPRSAPSSNLAPDSPTPFGFPTHSAAGNLGPWKGGHDREPMLSRCSKDPARRTIGPRSRQVANHVLRRARYRGTKPASLE